MKKYGITVLVLALLLMNKSVVADESNMSTNVLSLDVVEHVLEEERFPGDIVDDVELLKEEIASAMKQETTLYRERVAEEERVRIEQEEALLRREYRYESLNEMFSGTSFNGMAETFINVSESYNVPVDLLVAISAHETGYGKSDLATNHNNYGGIRCTERASYCVNGFSGYDTAYQGLSDKAYLLREYYLDYGLDTLSEIQPKYCPLSDYGCDVWFSNINSIIETVRLYTE